MSHVFAVIIKTENIVNRHILSDFFHRLMVDELICAGTVLIGFHIPRLSMKLQTCVEVLRKQRYFQFADLKIVTCTGHCNMFKN